MRRIKDTLLYLKHLHPVCIQQQWISNYRGIPFLEYYQKTTGQTIQDDFLEVLNKRHPNIHTLTHDGIQCTLQILSKFGITSLEACQDIHIFSMNPITVDNYGEILKEVGFVKVIPKYIIRYHTLVKSRTIAKLKSEGLLRSDVKLEEVLYDRLQKWSSSSKIPHNFPEDSTSILTVRLKVLEKYLTWRLAVTSEEFNKYCRNYLPLKHKPMSDIEEALDIAQDVIQLDIGIIRRNGFIISADPINTKLILENVKTLAGFHIEEAIKIEPGILKNNYNSLLQIRNILEEYNVPIEAQRRMMRVFCMCPETVKERLVELKKLKEYQIFLTNPRVLSMVVHKTKMMKRLEKIQAANKQCYSLNQLIASSKIFNNYISSFGSKVCGRDLAVLISKSLSNCKLSESEKMKLILEKLKRHKYWLHAALHIIDGNIQLLKKRFDDTTIFNNCQLLLYPSVEIEQYMQLLQKNRQKVENNQGVPDVTLLDACYNNLNYDILSDNQILSLILYEIEKKYHFSGDGIWSNQESMKSDSQI